jgi:hypothetical protein
MGAARLPRDGWEVSVGGDISSAIKHGHIPVQETF